MSWRFVDHTAELEVEIEAPTKEAVFGEAVEALRELVGVDESGEPVQLQVRAEADDDAALLAELLAELIYFADVSGFVAERADSIELKDREVRATLTGRYGKTSHLVKAITYHGLELREEDDGWRARVVLDV